jgi:heme exporter protein B
VLVIVLATLGFVAVGTLMSSMAVNTRLAELMLPVLLLPFLVPPVTSAVQITARLFAGRPFSEVTAWLRLLVAYDIIFVSACVLFFESTIEE